MIDSPVYSISATGLTCAQNRLQSASASDALMLAAGQTVRHSKDSTLISGDAEQNEYDVPVIPGNISS